MNGTNMLRTAIALTIPTLLFSCTRSEAERQADVREEEGEAREARAEANAERRDENAERREDNAERRADAERKTEPKIQPNQPEPTTNAADAVKGLTAASVKAITEARCMREEKCGNIGPGQDYASTSVCQAKISADWRDELNAYDCPGGVVTKELSECLEEIKNEDCASPFDTLGRVVACRSSDLCKSLD